MIEIPNYNSTRYINDLVPIAAVNEAVRHQKGDRIYVKGIRYVVNSVHYSVDLHVISVYIHRDD